MVDQTGGAFLLGTLGCVIASAGGQPLVTYLSGDKSITKPLPSALAVIVGIILIFLAVFWRPSGGTGAVLMQTLDRWGSNPAPYIVSLLFLWAHLQTLAIRQNIELATRKNDQHSMAEVLDRLVLPRQLNQVQANAIVQFLQSFPPQEVTIEGISGDGEASSYAAELHNALARAGWSVKRKWSTDIPNGGLGVHFTQTMEHSRIPSDFKNPKVDLMLKMALGYAGVFVDNSGGGSGIATTEDSLTLKVGQRRKDNAAMRA